MVGYIGGHIGLVEHEVVFLTHLPSQHLASLTPQSSLEQVVRSEAQDPSSQVIMEPGQVGIFGQE